MEYMSLHSWNLSPREAVEIQKSLKAGLEFRKLTGPVRTVAGADVAYSKKTDRVWAGVVVFTYPGLKKLEEKWARGQAAFPYIPGLLSFREIPVLLEAVNLLEIGPDLFLCDGQGIAHPRGLGLASHLGLVLDRPTIGCAKSRLVGDFTEPGENKGDYAHLRYKGRIIGVVVRTRKGVRPLFVSQGNKITLEESLEKVLTCCCRYRMPEPTRQAHLLVNNIRRGEEDD
jgi:deoxyribonuclease V